MNFKKFHENLIQIQKHYENINFSYATLKILERKEIMISTAKKCSTPMTQRYLQTRNAQQTQFLARGVTKYLERKLPFNWYMSVARYQNGLPKTSFKLEHLETRKAINKQWSKDHWKHISTYPLFIDIDSPDHSDYWMNISKLTAIGLRNRLIKENKTFTITFSGMGFHFIINERKTKEETYEPLKKNGYIARLEKQAQKYHEDFNLIDMKIYDNKRMMKIPYSLAIYPNEIYVCTPMRTATELDEFNIRNYIWQPNNVIDFQNPYIHKPSEQTHDINKSNPSR